MYFSYFMGDVLYVGGDDSNHAGDAKGEFIVAVFSLDYKDSLVQSFPNRRNISKVDEWLEKGGDYRFTICTGEIYKSSQNLPKIMPSLIENYLDQVDLDVRVIKSYLDGRLEGTEKRKMRSRLERIGGMEKVVVKNFIKKRRVGGRIVKGYYCPPLVWIADVLANSLYRHPGPISDLLEHEKMVRSPEL